MDTEILTYFVDTCMHGIFSSKFYSYVYMYVLFLQEYMST